MGSPAGYRESDCQLNSAPFKGWKYSDVEPNEDEEGFQVRGLPLERLWGRCVRQRRGTRQRPRRALSARTGGVARRSTFGCAAACWTVQRSAGSIATTVHPSPPPASPPPLPPSPPPPPPSAEGWRLMGGSINGSAAFDFSGSAISMSQDGTRVAIGASLSDGTSKKNAGHVRVFGWDSGSSSWDQVGADIDGEGALDQFGRAVSLSRRRRESRDWCSILVRHRKGTSARLRTRHRPIVGSIR